jgi:glycine cleavage system H protein
MTVIFILGTIIFFLGLDWAHRRLSHRTAVQAIPVSAGPLAFRQPRVPEGIFFTQTHTWLNLFPSGKVRCGIDDFVSGLVGTPAVTLLRAEGTSVRKGDAIARLQNGARSLTVFAPIDGDIVDVNGSIVENPGLLREKTFSDGWLYAIAPRRSSDLKTFLLGTETRSWMQNEMRRLRDFFAASVSSNGLAVALQDGGMPVSGALGEMDANAWNEFQQQFLQPR